MIKCSLLQRFIFLLLITVVIVVFILAVGLTLTDNARGARAVLQLYRGPPTFSSDKEKAINQHLLHLDRQALDEAYHAHVIKLWTVWLASGAPKAATELRNGLAVARTSYVLVTAQIAQREQELADREENK